MKIKITDLPKGHSRFVHKPTRVTFYTVHRLGTKEAVEQRYSMHDPLVLKVGDVVIVKGTEVPPEFQPLTRNRFAEVSLENEQTTTEKSEPAPKSKPESRPTSGSKPIESIK